MTESQFPIKRPDTSHDGRQAAEYGRSRELPLRMGIIPIHAPYETGVATVKSVVARTAVDVIARAREQDVTPIRLSCYVAELPSGLLRAYITPFSRPEYQLQMDTEAQRRVVHSQHEAAIQAVAAGLQGEGLTVEEPQIITGSWQDPAYPDRSASAVIGLNEGYKLPSDDTDYLPEDVATFLGNRFAVTRAHVCSAGGVDETGNLRDPYEEKAVYVAFGTRQAAVDADVAKLTDWARQSEQELFVVQDYDKGVAYTVKRK